MKDSISWLLEKYNVSNVFLGLRLYDSNSVMRALVSKNNRNFRYIIVSGSKNFNVKIKLDDDFSLINLNCDCEVFSPKLGCPHSMCACIHMTKYLNENVSYREIKTIHNLISLYSKKQYNNLKTLNFDVYIDFSNSSNLNANMSMKIGIDKMYVIRNVSTFLDDYKTEKEREYGKQFTFDLNKQEFDKIDSSFIDFLCYVEEEKSKTQTLSGKEVKFVGKGINILFNNLKNKEFYFSNKEKKIVEEKIIIVDEDPKIDVFLSENEENYNLSKGTKKTFRISDDLSYIYFNHKIYHTSQEFRKLNKYFYTEFLESNISNLIIPNEKKNEFLTKVLRKTSSKNKINLDKNISEEIILYDLEASLILDIIEGELIGKLEFCYGDNKINPLNASTEKEDNLIRDLEKEQKILYMLENTNFKVRNGEFYIDNPDEIFEYISNDVKLSELLDLDYLKIMYSSSKKKLMNSTQNSVKSVFSYNANIDMLEVSFDIENFENEDLKSFYNSIKEKKKYFKLKSGDFVPINEDVNDLFYSLYESGDFDLKNISEAQLRIPKYRSFYLDSFINSRELNYIEENVDFKKLVKSVRDNKEIKYEIPSGIETKLREYQVFGYNWLRNLHEFGFGGILADEMGLGKTLQAISFIKYLADNGEGESLVIAPTSTLYNWLSEFRKFTPTLDVVVVSGNIVERTDILNANRTHDVYITSYPLLRNDFPKYENKNFATVIADEAQFIKNHESLSAKAIKKLNAKTRIALTGTPIENRLSELHSMFDFIMPGYLLSKKKFVEKYEKPIIKDEDKGVMEKLKTQIRPFILRRLKKDVLKELPGKIEQELLIELEEEQKLVYLSYLQNLKDEIETEVKQKGYNRSHIKILAALTRLRQIAIDPSVFIENYAGRSAKIDALMELLPQIFESDSRVLLFSSFTSVLKIIVDRFIENGVSYKYLDGSTPISERQKAIEEFNAGEGDVFLISLKAGGTGLNLTSANTVIHFDPWWNPAVENQATDRAHRIGQDKTVQVIRMITKGTIEEKIMELQNFKKELVNKVIEDGETLISSLSEAEILSLFDI